VNILLVKNNNKIHILLFDTHVRSFTINTMSEINLINITNDTMGNLKNSTLSYKISLGTICACLCLLTITGNLLVLITFRRIRTVSIRIFNLSLRCYVFCKLRNDDKIFLIFEKILFYFIFFR